ncbi:hypothetical protein ACJW31_11G004500 [Castanea mollissima]
MGCSMVKIIGLELNFAKSELVPVEEVQAMAELTPIVGCEVQLIDNFTNKKEMTSHCYRIAYQSMERSLMDEEINELQWNVREQVQSKPNVVGSMEILLG